ncbi:unnamed protein product [Prorocentrum cordatum]|uniref:Calreticulin n=1 Tax=Prorocentrum cordatum TaxID=2364126 RepID=A0ABN9TC58_9DINO|nr:unnamed protein product [Polarella glacialis]
MQRVLACAGAAALADGRVFFSETFGEGWESRWAVGSWGSAKLGRWGAGAGRWFRDEAADRGLQTSEDANHFLIATSFETFSNEGRDLVIQYQVKYEQDVMIGGGYLKIGPKLEDLTTFGKETPYNIMFGPDQWGDNRKTQLIFNYKGTPVAKTSDLSYRQGNDFGVSHLYRMVLKPDNTVRVEIDEATIYEGSIKEDWDVLKKWIPDLDDRKPKDWVDISEIEDPEDNKPDDWVEEKRIVDESASKPDGWDEEDDGEWIAPMKDNPAYKGEWSAKKITNPAYRGDWTFRMIANPKYVDDDMVYSYPNFGFLGFDVYQEKGGTIFDNIIVCDDVAEADEFAKRWRALNKVEKARRKEEDDARTAGSAHPEKHDGGLGARGRAEL